MFDLSWGIYCLGGLLLISSLCLVLIKTSSPELKFKPHPSTCDLLDYAVLIEDNVIALKSGGLMALYKIELPDLSMMPQSHLNHIYDVAQSALLKLNGNYCLHIDLIRNRSDGYTPFLEVENPVLEDIEARRKQLFSNQGCFYSGFYLSITFMGNSNTAKALKDLLIKHDKNIALEYNSQTIVHEFKQSCSNVVNTLKECFDIRPLTSKVVDIEKAIPSAFIQYQREYEQRLTKDDDLVWHYVNPPLDSDQPQVTIHKEHRNARTTAQSVNQLNQCEAIQVEVLDLPDAQNQATTKDSSLEANSYANFNHANASQDEAPSFDESNLSDRTRVEPQDEVGTSLGQKNAQRDACSAPNQDLFKVEPIDPVSQELLRKANQRQTVIDLHQNYSQVLLNNTELPLHSTLKRQINVHEGLSFIHQCLTGIPQNIACPAKTCYLDAILSSQDFQPGITPIIGQNYVCVIAIEGLPQESTQGMLEQLAALPFSYRFSTRFVYFDNIQSNIMLSKYRRLWDQKTRGFIAQLLNVKHSARNQNADNKVKEIDDAIRALDNNELIFGAYTANLLIMDSSLTSLQSKVIDAARVIESLGFTIRIEGINATEAFIGSLPGHFYENLRRPIVSQDVLVDLLPLSSPSAGEKYAPNPLYGHHKSPLMQVRAAGMGSYLLNLHDQDLGNTMVFGPPGSGKSVLLGSFVLNLLRYRHMRVFIFDQGYSFYALTKALQGTHIELNNNNPLLCPFHDLETPLDRSYCARYLHSLCLENNIPVDPYLQKEINSLFQLLALKPEQDRSLSAAHILISEQRLKDAIIPYMRGKNQDSILDGDANLSLDKTLTTFECAEIFKENNKFTRPVLKHLFHLLTQQFDGNPAAIVMDEAWLLMQNNTFAQEVISWFKTLRKFNVLVIMATQSLSDIEQSENFQNLLECAKTRVYLANYAAESLNVATTYEQLGLSKKEIYNIAHAKPKRDYFFVKGDQHIMFNLMLSEPELRLLSYSGPQCKSTVDRLYNTYGSSFYKHAS